MPIWNDCSMEVYAAEYEYEETPCVVKIDGGKIRVEWKNEGKLYIYEGSEHGAGHYKVKATTHDGRGTFHVFPDDLPDDAALEGWYYEEKAKGMWRIVLDGRVGAS